MDFNYGSSFGERSPSAYETLLLDAIIGDATLYTRQDMVEASWSVVRADSECVAPDEARVSQLSRRYVGAGGRRRNAGAPRPRVEETIMPPTIEPEKILKELAALWADSGKQGQAESGSGVLRACSMTLLVLAEASEDTQDLGETIAALMPEHPARAVLVRLSGGGDRSLTERVYSQCWMPFGQRRQICCEQIEITVSDAAMEDLRSVVLPLVVADLPLIVWCRSTRLVAMPEFGAIAAHGAKVIFDSADVPEPAGFLQRAETAIGRGVMLADLAWTCLRAGAKCCRRSLRIRKTQRRSRS